MAEAQSPLQMERNELGYSLQPVREGRTLRVIHRPCEGSDVCVFFVHGGGGRAGQFKHLIRKVQKMVNVVAFDFLGHGESPHINDPKLYTADQHLEDLVAVFNKYKQHRNVYVAHSFGNIHMLRHLKMLNTRGDIDLIAGVVMVGIGATAPLSGGLVTKLPTFLLELLRPLARSASNAAMFSPHVDPELIRFENSISDTNRMYTMKKVGKEVSSQTNWDRWLEEGAQVLTSKNIPRLLISGNQDGVFSMQSAFVVKRRFEIAKDSHHVLDGVGHIPMLEAPEEVGRILVQFLKSSSGMDLVRKEGSVERKSSSSERRSKERSKERSLERGSVERKEGSVERKQRSSMERRQRSSMERKQRSSMERRQRSSMERKQRSPVERKERSVEKEGSGSGSAESLR